MTARDRAALRIGATLVVAVVLGLRLLPWTVRVATGYRERVTERVAAAERARALVAAGPALRDSLTGALATVVRLAPALLDGTTRAEAAATLSSWVTGSSLQHRLRVRSIESQPDSAPGPIAPVRVRAELEGDISGVMGLLRSVEYGSPLLTLRETGLTALDPSSSPRVPELIRIQIEIGGWYYAKGAR